MHSAHSNLDRRLVIAAVIFLTVGLPVQADSSSKPVKDGNVTARAFADREAVAPGETLRVAVALRMEKDWHVYWRSPGPGGTGLPTKIEWTVPQGYEVGATEFPVPQAKYDKILEETSYILEDQAVFVTSIRAPATAKVGADAKLSAKVSWLACKQNCIPGGAELSFSLPIVSQGTAAQAANKALFEEARAAFPIPVEKAKQIKLGGAIDKKAARPGEKFTATLTVEIAKGHHVQSHKPLQKGLIAAYVFVDGPEGFYVGEIEYPKGEMREDKVLGKLSEYSGKIEIKIPVEVDEEADNQPRRLSGLLQYQICTDGGTCYPPQHVTWSIPVQMEGGAAPDLTAAGYFTSVSDGGVSASGKDVDSSGASAHVAGDGRSFLLRAQEWLFSRGYVGVILAGILGGFILNFMPCVLPVISLKVLSFVRQAHDERWRVFRLGLTYSAGIMVFYSVLAVLFYWKGQGWGEHFQSPVFVIAVAGVVLAFGLSLFGVFTVFTPRVVNVLGEKTEGEGYLSAFGTGLLATLLGTACTAPFLSAAIGYATRLPVIQGTSIFLAVGFGMAFPFVLLTYKPAWLRFIPKPGPWMGVFEGIMGFLLIGTVIWLINPLRRQIGDYGLLLGLIFLLAVAIAAWIKGKIEFGAPMARKVKLYFAAILVLVVGWCLPFRVMATIPELRDRQNEHEELLARGLFAKYGKDLDWSKGIPWQPYVRELATKDVRDGYTIFVDYTASWCASCKANLAAFIDQPDVIATMRELSVIPYEADFSNYNEHIKQDLARFGRAGVPMYLVYSPEQPDNPEVLPELLSQSVIIDALRRAGPSRPKALAKGDSGA